MAIKIDYKCPFKRGLAHVTSDLGPYNATDTSNLAWKALEILAFRGRLPFYAYFTVVLRLVYGYFTLILRWLYGLSCGFYRTGVAFATGLEVRITPLCFLVCTCAMAARPK
jgi:hypothetical protein